MHAGEDNRDSVVSGLVTSARVITAAALIMVFVFGSFVLNGDPTIKQFGVGLAVAVILDATVVRCLLVPAVDDPDGQGQLVDALLAGPRRPAHQHRGRRVLLGTTTRRSRTSPRSPTRRDRGHEQCNRGPRSATDVQGRHRGRSRDRPGRGAGRDLRVSWDRTAPARRRRCGCCARCCPLRPAARTSASWTWSRMQRRCAGGSASRCRRSAWTRCRPGASCWSCSAGCTGSSARRRKHGRRSCSSSSICSTPPSGARRPTRAG